MKKIILIFLLLFSLISFPCIAEKGKYNLPIETITITKQNNEVLNLKAEIAVKKEERNYGFMNRKKIPHGTGMLFVFENEQQLSFWMKNTPHPLSIAYITKNGIIKDIFDMKPYSVSSVQSSGSVKYALEVPQGWFSICGISKGDKVDIPLKYK